MKISINSFGAGEISEKMLGRPDLPGVQRACRHLKNFLPRITGGVFRRPGTGFCWYQKFQDKPSCLISFNFSNTDSVVIELADRTMLFGDDGALIQDGEGTFIEINAPWEQDEIFSVNHVQINDLVYFAQGNHWPQRMIRLDNTVWVMKGLDEIFADQNPADGYPWPPMRDENSSSITLTAGDTAGSNITVTASDSVFQPTHVGGFFQIAHRRETAFSELTIPVFARASEVMTFTGQPSAGNTFTINGLVYTWRAAVTLPYEVLIGADQTESAENMVLAINAGTPATLYGPGTSPNPYVTAADGGTTASAGAATGILTSNGNPDLTSGTPNFIVIIDDGADERRYRIDPSPAAFGSSATTCEVRQMPNPQDTLQNLLKAINLTGLGDGSDYHNNGGNFTIHPTVAASTETPNSLRLTAKTAGVAGNTIPTTVTAWAGADMNRLKFNAATLTGGTAGASNKVRIEARNSGAEGNNITVAENQANAAWIGTSLTGGTDFDGVSAGFEVLGGYKIWSYGIIKGTVILERRISQNPDTYEALRQWRLNNDRTVQEEGVAEYPQFLRLRIIDGAGTASAEADVPRFVIEANDSKIAGLVKVTNFVSVTEVKVDVVAALQSTKPTTLWAEGAWSDYRGYPRGVAFHNQRLVFMGNTHEPQTMWFSATADFQNFRRGLNDSDSFVATIAANESSPIVWCQSVGQGLLIGKESEEWLGTASDGQSAVSPTNFDAKRQSAFGSAHVKTVVVGSHVIFAEVGARTLRNIRYAWDQQAFDAQDLNELSSHLAISGIKQIAYARRPESIMWVVTNDGELISMSYRSERDVIAWARHPMTGIVESVAVVNGANDLDDVYIATLRTINETPKRFVERFDMQTLIELDKADIDTPSRRSLLTYLDCSIRVTGDASTTWSGFDHLEGELVSIQADGSFHNQVRVVEGSVLLERPASTILVGIDYAADSMLTPYKIDMGVQDGTAAGRRVAVREVQFITYRSSAGYYRDSYDSRAEPFNIKFRQADNEVNMPTPVFTGTIPVVSMPGWQDEIRVTLQPRNAEPLNILAIIPSFTVSGN